MARPVLYHTMRCPVGTSKGECGWNGNSIPSHSRKHKDIVGSMKLQCVLQPSLPLVPMLCTCHGHTIVVSMDFSCKPVQRNGNRWVRVPLMRDFEKFNDALVVHAKRFHCILAEDRDTTVACNIPRIPRGRRTPWHPTYEERVWPLVHPPSVGYFVDGIPEHVQDQGQPHPAFLLDI